MPVLIDMLANHNLVMTVVFTVALLRGSTL